MAHTYKTISVCHPKELTVTFMTCFCTQNLHIRGLISQWDFLYFGLWLLDYFLYAFAFTLCTFSSSLAFNVFSLCWVASADRHTSTVSFKVSFRFCRGTFLIPASFMPNTILSLSIGFQASNHTMISCRFLTDPWEQINNCQWIILHFTLFVEFKYYSSQIAL